jgi:hypothetical protein
MPQVMISFLGLATLFDFDCLPPFAPPGVLLPKLRMVLLNGSQAVIDQNGLAGMTPHIAKMQIFKDQFDAAEIQGSALPPSLAPDSMVMDLTGVTLSIPNATGIFLNHAGGLPHLSSFLAVPADIWPPSELVYNQDPTSASCYFDFSSGTITGFQIPTRRSSVGIMQLVIDTESDPQLLIAPFGGGTTLVTLHSVRSDENGPIPAGVNVMNFADGDGTQDTDDDFNLNYLVAEKVPMPRAFPRTLDLPISPWRYNLPPVVETLEVTPSCSNSNYP